MADPTQVPSAAATPITDYSQVQEERRILPTYGQWSAFRAARDGHAMKRLCVVCEQPVTWFQQGLVRMGCLIRKWDEVQVGTDSLGDAIIELRSRAMPMSTTGLACGACQYLMAKAEGAEGARYERAVAGWRVSVEPGVVPAWMVALGATPAQLHAARSRGAHPTKRVPYIDMHDAVILMPRPSTPRDEAEREDRGVPRAI